MTPTDQSVRPIHILLIEDNPADVRLTREALTEAKVLNTLHVTADGVAAMAFLRQEGMQGRTGAEPRGVAGAAGGDHGPGDSEL